MTWIIALLVGLIIGFLLGVWYCRSRHGIEAGPSAASSDSLQGTVANGQPGSWQDVAADNGVEDPTQVPSGTPIRPPDD